MAADRATHREKVAVPLIVNVLGFFPLELDFGFAAHAGRLIGLVFWQGAGFENPHPHSPVFWLAVIGSGIFISARISRSLQGSSFFSASTASRCCLAAFAGSDASWASLGIMVVRSRAHAHSP